jgi:excisionase family DNA binding protein
MKPQNKIPLFPPEGMRICDYLTSGEAAQLLGTTKSTLRKWHKTGKLKAYKHPITRFLLYKLKDINDLLENLKKSKEK